MCAKQEQLINLIVIAEKINKKLDHMQINFRKLHRGKAYYYIRI